MAAGAISRLPTSQIYESDIDDDIPAYKVDNPKAVTDFNGKTHVDLLSIQSQLSFQKEGINYLQLAECADAPDSPYFHDKLSILSRQARLDGVTQKIVLLSFRIKGLGQKHNSTISGHFGERQMYSR